MISLNPLTEASMCEMPLRHDGKNCCCQGEGSMWWFTFECDPVLLPLPSCDQLQLLLLLQGHQRFEEQPSCLAHHSLLFLIQQIQLLQGTKGLATGVFCFRRGLHILQVHPAHLQLSHEVLINVLPQGITADCVGGLASLGQDMAGATRPQ